MGKQFQVYLLPSDAVKVVEVLRQKIGLRLLASRSPGPEPIDIESPILTEAGTVRADCLLAPMASSLHLGHIEKQGYWYVDIVLSEAIEFTACYFDGTTIKRGRMYYQRGFYDAQDNWRNKSPEFLSWAEEVFRTAKKLLKRDSGLNAYIGEDARRWRSAGGIFVELAVKDKPPILAK